VRGRVELLVETGRSEQERAVRRRAGAFRRGRRLARIPRARGPQPAADHTGLATTAVPGRSRTLPPTRRARGRGNLHSPGPSPQGAADQGQARRCVRACARPGGEKQIVRAGRRIAASAGAPNVRLHSIEGARASGRYSHCEAGVLDESKVRGKASSRTGTIVDHLLRGGAWVSRVVALAISASKRTATIGHSESPRARGIPRAAGGRSPHQSM
jgi:hypothetical protein